MKRRNFIRLSTFISGAWLLSDIMDAYPKETLLPPGINFSPDPLLKIEDNGDVTIYMIKQEMGQNVVTALPFILAEELEIDPKNIRIETLPYDQLNAGSYTTWASSSIKGTWMNLRKVGATAKKMLLLAASIRWNVDYDACKVSDGKITNTKNSSFLYYKDLIREASALPIPEKVELKDIKNFKLIGKQMMKTNLSAIVNGTYSYTMDVKLPGQLYAVLVRCPQYNGELLSWDISALKDLNGFVKVVPVKQMEPALNRNAVAIVATNSWAALQGQRLLKVEWSFKDSKVRDSKALSEEFKSELLTKKPALVFGKEKNVPFEAIDHPELYQASYQIPYLAHAAMEPINCTAWFRDGKFEIWGGFQAPMFINSTLSKLFGVKPSDILVHLMPMGGSFGRKEKIDNVAEAMQVSKAMEAPVQMLCSRVDDLQNDFYRHASYHMLSAVSSRDKISQWSHQLGIATFPEKEISGPWHMFGGVTNDLCYSTDEYQSAFYPVESPLPLGSWRSISFSPNVFAIESFIDELAVHNKVDPLEFRFNLLDEKKSKDNLRLRNVLSECANQAGWRKKAVKGRFRGIGCCMYGHSDAYVAHIMEISVSKEKKIKIHRCIVAADCGLVIDPDGLKAQIEGSFVWALSGIFKNEITFSNGIVDQQSFHDYEVLRINEMPSLEIILIQGVEKPGGGGEPAVPSVGPALCNAIFAATGIRIRTLPIKKYGFSLAD